MTAIEITESGGPEVLQPVERPVPEPGSGEILIAVAAAGVNRPDVVQRLGLYPPPPGASDLPGLEVAGEVAAVGEAVTEWKEGDRVCALVSGGGYAQYATAPAAQVLRVPAGLDSIQAAGIPETFFTVWTNMFDRGHLAAGESILIHGGSSGIGTTAIQLAREFGATAYVTVGNAEKARFCEELGAVKAINYREQDFVEEIKSITDGAGVDVILDIVGGDYLPRNIRLLRVEGRLLQVSLMGGSKGELDLGRVMRNRLTVTGSTLRPRSVAQKGEIAASLRERVWPLFEAGKIGPVIHQTFPLAEASRAHELMETSAHIGKIILSVE
ncbi:MAG: NAD(P)H-quinone oxidoreductase [Alphaproteobacteria bacterium]|nr:NAD(P)H-quinone oxidoreductase [Alphaproteobacteria bacterium]MCZ6587753.1 NAD(P)H-quinone oxidoreductase [Alphaproteobacteria bacterium]MCZ6592009.1 NAD(P)H-quinone oxidoreductase [Alphaproteobacteria bacterium]